MSESTSADSEVLPFETDSSKTALDEERRGMPIVGLTDGRGHNILLGVSLCIATGLLVWRLWPTRNAESSEDLPAQTDEVFDRGMIADIEIPVFDFPPQVFVSPEATLLPSASSLSTDELPPDGETDLEAENDLRERRKRSPLIVFNGSPTIDETVDTSSLNTLRARQQELLERVGREGQSPDQSLQAESDLDDIEGRLGTTQDGVSAVSLADRQYTIAQGRILHAILETAISSDLPGMVRGIVSMDVYGEDGSRILIDKGSRLVGQYRAGVAGAQTRIFVIWNRVITPGGIIAPLTSPGVDQLGRSGLPGRVDSHFWERFGASTLLSVIGAGAAQSNENQINIELGENFNESATIVLENTAEIRPTLYKNQGDRIGVLFARDVNFRRAMESTRIH